MRRLFFSLAVGISCLSYAASTSPELTGPAIGSMAPDFKAHNSVTGATQQPARQGRDSDFLGLLVWTRRREPPILEGAQKLVGKDKMTVFAVSFQETPEAAKAVAKFAATWQINIIEDRNGWIASRYSISSIPHLFIIDRNGKILANHLG
jgi:AhpC/TSA family